MAYYRTDRTERGQLYKLWIEQEDRPCEECGSKENRQIAHIVPYHAGGETTPENCRVLCRACNWAEHAPAKFLVGDRVRLTARIPKYLGFTEYDRTRPRTIIEARYSPELEANVYRLGSNGHGRLADGQPQDGIEYLFRSYQLEKYEPRQYHFKRKYTMRADDTRLTAKSTAGKQTARANS